MQPASLVTASDEDELTQIRVAVHALEKQTADYRRLQAECSTCVKCGWVQAEPNWCHLCKSRTAPPDWAKNLLDELDAARKAAQDAEERLEAIREVLETKP